MRSSIELSLKKQNTPVKKPDFQKDIIMPNIYSNQNFQIINNNRYPHKQQRKVITAKKAKVQQVVEAIVSKKNLEVSKKVPLYNHRPSKPYILTKRKSLSAHNCLNSQMLTIDIDQQINQRAMQYEQQASAVKEKIKQTMQKVAATSNIENKQSQQVNFYLTQLSPRKKSKSNTKQQIKNVFVSTSKIFTTKVKGYVEQQEQIQNKRQARNRKQINLIKQTTIKPRPKTAQNTNKRKLSQQIQIHTIGKQQKSILLRSNSLINTKLNRFQIGRQVAQNMKVSRKNSQDKQKMQNILDAIQSSCLDHTLTKSGIINSLNKLGSLWKSQKQFLYQHNRPILDITHQALDLVKSIRKKQLQLAQLDNQYMDIERQNNNFANN